MESAGAVHPAPINSLYQRPMTLIHLVMAALVAATHVFTSAQAVDGETKPRHDETGASSDGHPQGSVVSLRSEHPF